MAGVKKAGAKKRVLKRGYVRKVKSGRAFYVNEKTGNRVLKSTATRAAKKRRSTKKRSSRK